MTLTDEWMELYDADMASGMNPENSFWYRMALSVLPEGVDDSDPRVVAALANIRRAVENRNTGKE